MAYRINGPTQIGDTGQLNEILGNLRLTDISTTQGSVFYVNASGNVTGLGPGTSGQALLTQGAGANPVWGTSFGVDESVSVKKSGNQSIGPGPAAAVIIGFTAVPVTPEYNTGSFDATTGVFTAAASSKYRFNLEVGYTNTVNSGTRILKLRRNGVSYAQKTVQPTGSISINQHINIDINLQLVATDTVDFEFESTGIVLGSVSILAAETWLSAERIVA